MQRLSSLARRTTLAVVLAGATAAAAIAQSRDPEEASVRKVVADFHAALERGDSAAALALLLPGVVILESGGAEDLAEYRSHHLKADIEFARAVPSVRTVRSVTVRGVMATVAGTSTTQGEFRGRAVNSAGAELMVLEKGPDGWRISAIHWSSRRRE